MEEKLNPHSRNRRNVINIGTSLMVVVLMGLSFAVIAALAISSAKNNLNLSQTQARHTTEYYEACSNAYKLLDENGWQDGQFTVEINDSQNLVVEVERMEIVSMTVENIDQWNGNESLPVHIAD